MKRLEILVLAVCLLPAGLFAAARVDWLVDGAPFKAHVSVGADAKDVTLDNGLIRRVIRRDGLV